MKLLNRKKISAVKEQPKAHKKSHKNDLPPDEYKDLIPPVEIPLSDTGKLVISVKRGGEFGLPKVDIRFYATTNVYTGFTKKGINLNLDKLTELTTLLLEVEDECDKEGLFEEFNDEEGEEETE